MANSTIVNEKNAPKKRDLRLPRDFRYFDNLIQDNIDYINIDKQTNEDALQYAPIKIQHDNPPMSVRIHKKKYTHRACAMSACSMFPLCEIHIL